jgi:hypothetical protein
MGRRAFGSSGDDDVLRAAQAGAGWAFSRIWRELAPAVAGYARAQRVGRRLRVHRLGLRRRLRLGLGRRLRLGQLRLGHLDGRLSTRVRTPTCPRRTDHVTIA